MFNLLLYHILDQQGCVRVKVSLPGTLNAADERISLVAAITQVQHRLRDTFQRWMDENAIRSDLSPEQLVWEWFGPLNVVRVLYFHGQATEAERLAGRRVAEQHLDFFLAAL